MHIVHLVPEMQQGGVETVVSDLNRELIKAGHQSTVISNGGAMVQQIEDDGGRHITLNVCSKNPLTFPKRVHVLRKTLCTMRHAPCILHAHSRVPAWLTWHANRKLKYPFVTTVHGFNSISRYSAIMTRGDRVICVSHPVKDYITANYGTDPGKIRVVHGGIKPERFDPETIDQDALRALQSRFGLTGKRVITAIGRITELKDYETFIRAIKTGLARDPNLCGLIVGHVRHDKQEYYARLQTLIRNLELTEQVFIATDLTDPGLVYAASDVVVSCSKKPESFGLTLVEALAMNVPVIATRHGGPLDIIRENTDGFFFEPGQAEELAERILDAPDKVTCAFREDTLSRFNAGNMARGNLNVYEELCPE